jgi:hypothetical protein
MNDAQVPLELDPVAVASMVSFQYVIDGRSLISQVRRRSWLSTDLGAELGRYGRQFLPTRTAAEELLRRLREELANAFAGAERITVLLSGGLDSRLTTGVLLSLSRRGIVTDDIRALTWGIPTSRDRHYGHEVARHLGVDWIPIELGPADLLKNIDIAAHELAGLVSPVHLHAMHAVSQLDWASGDRILASTLGNGLGRGQYLYRHVSYAKSLQPQDWLNLMRPRLYTQARARLVDELHAFRRRLEAQSPIAVHECEMLAHYASGLLLMPFDLLRRIAAPLHQAFTDPCTYSFLWSLSPMVRREGLWREALRRCDPELTHIPYALTNRPPRRLGRRGRTDLSPHVHRYPIWTARDLADDIDQTLSRAWFDDTGIFDGVAVRRAWERIRSSPTPHPQTAYLLLWLCALRRLLDEVVPVERRRTAQPLGTSPKAPPERNPSPAPHPPWGFAGRGHDTQWRRLISLPRQVVDVARAGAAPMPNHGSEGR